MNFKKFLCIGLIVLLSVFALSACRGNDGPDEPTFYTVSFVTNSDTTILSESIEAGKNATAPEAPVKNGYEFLGWYDGDSAWSFDTAVNKDTTLTAKWQAIEYTITYKDGETVLNFTPNKYTVNDEIAALPIPNKDNYNFMGWYKNADFTMGVQSIAAGTMGDLVLYAQFSVKNYGITYELDGGINNESNPLSYSIESEFPVNLSNPTKEGYKFLGWYTDANLTTSIEKIDSFMGSVVVFARWEKLDTPSDPIDPNPPVVDPEKEYTITYYEGETKLDLTPNTYKTGAAVNLPAPAVKEHYYFAGWYTTATFDNGTKIESISETSSGDVVLYAKYTPVSYTITYNLAGGTNNSENPETYTILDTDMDNALVLENPTKEGYLFAGWYTDPNYKNHVDTLKGKSGDIVLYAKWVREGESGLLTPEDKFD